MNQLPAPFTAVDIPVLRELYHTATRANAEALRAYGEDPNYKDLANAADAALDAFNSAALQAFGDLLDAVEERDQALEAIQDIYETTSYCEDISEPFELARLRDESLNLVFRNAKLHAQAKHLRTLNL